MEKLKTAFLFGIRRKSVKEYVEELNKSTNLEKEKLQKEIAELKKKCEEIKNENNTLSEKVKAVDLERQFIADAILEAKKEAQRIKEEAKKDLENYKREKEEETKSYEKRLEDAKCVARDYQKVIESSMDSLKEEVAFIINGKG